MIFESTFAPWRRTFIEERGKDIIFIEIMNRLEQEMLQTKEFQDAVQEAIKNKGRAFVPEDIFDYPVLKQHFMDFIRTMIPIYDLRSDCGALSAASLRSGNANTQQSPQH